MTASTPADPSRQQNCPAAVPGRDSPTRSTPSRAGWMARLGVALLVVGVLPISAAAGTSRSVDPGPSSGSGPRTAPDRVHSSNSEARATTDTVVLTQRPLRTFRGETVRVGQFAEPDQSIGVVRPLRVGSGYSIYNNDADRFRTGVVRARRYDQTGQLSPDGLTPGRFTTGRVILQSYPGVNRYPEKSIGIVRAYRYPTTPQRNLPTTVTGDPGPVVSPSSIDPMPDVRPRFIRVTAVADVEVPAAVADDAWALLNAGYYREARQRFNALDAESADESAPDADAREVNARTGRGLAAALAGDLAAAADLLPDTPRLPDGFALSSATQRRLAQTAEYLLADEPEFQARLRTLLPPAIP